MKLKECFDNIISGEWGEECLVGEKGTKILRTTNFTNIGKIDYRDVVERKISDAKIDKKRLMYGDIILEKSGGTDKTPVGRVVFCDHNIEKDTYLCNNFTVGLRTNTNYCSKYLFYLMFFNHQQGKTLALQNKTTGIRNLKVGSYLNCKISDTSIEEQQRIADELDKVSELIEKRQQQLYKLDLLIKSRFVEMFGDPINENINSNKIKLGEVAILKAGKNVTSANIHNKNEQYPYPCYGGNGIRGYVSNYSHDGCFCLIGRQGALCGNVQLAEGKFYPTEHAVVVKIKKAVNVKWLYYILTYLNLNRFQTGAAQPGLNIGILNSVEISFPPIDLQNQFADFIEKVEQNKAKIKNSLDELNTLKKALMQKYFG